MKVKKSNDYCGDFESFFPAGGDAGRLGGGEHSGAGGRHKETSPGETHRRGSTPIIFHFLHYKHCMREQKEKFHNNRFNFLFSVIFQFHIADCFHTERTYLPYLG